MALKYNICLMFSSFWWILLLDRGIRRGRREKSCPGSATSHHGVYKVVGSEGDCKDFPENQPSSLIVQQGYSGGLVLERGQFTTDAEYSLLFF